MSNSPKSNRDEELFELCKEVYKRFPKWNNKEKMFWKRLIDDDRQVKILNYGQITTRDGAMVCPLYNSDYLLEKLPKSIWTTYGLTIYPDGVTWCAEFIEPDGLVGIGANPLQKCDSPLKALLKLTLALHEAGELK